MIKFSENIYIDRFIELNMGKRRLKDLEKVLRIVGNFEKQDIIVEKKNK